MTILFTVCAGVSAAFALSSFLPGSVAALVSLSLSFATALAFFIATRRLIKNPSRMSLSLVRKLSEYVPFILFTAFIIRRSGDREGSFAFDLVSALLWVAALVSSLIIQWRLADKRLERFLPSCASLPASAVRKKTIITHLLEWADALLQAGCLVLLINLFIFQMYAIPSESMVPEFMIGDRVVVLKTPSGPKFPLSEVGIPRMRDYHRGDIVVFSNPHYNDTRQDRIRSFASQLVYMLTFTAVNINLDEYGAVKADPLVKRVCGVAGEKLMMVDGVLYARTEGMDDYRPVSEDASWATWDIASLPRSQLALVKNVPLSKEAFDLVTSVESKRANLDLEAAKTDAIALANRFDLLKPSKDSAFLPEEIFSPARMEMLSLFQSNDDVTRVLLTTNGGGRWFRDFMTSWTLSSDRSSLYEKRARNLDILIKLTFGKLVVRNAQLFYANATAESFSADEERRALLAEADSWRLYLAINDQRNMNEFPKDPADFIPADCFFLMGDNRFNSLDMRHSYTVKLSRLDAKNPYSITYRSNIDPQYVPINRILGTAAFRFWPPSRIGVP